MKKLLAGLIVAGLVSSGAGIVRAGEAVPGDFVSGNEDWTSPTLGKMKWIKPGTFMMGSPATEVGRVDYETGRVDYEKQHQVTLTQGFLLMDHEVTQGEWLAVIGINPSLSNDCGSSCPVEQVSWDDTQVYIEKVSARDKVQYRLPTEAEWEYAARAGTTAMYSGTIEASSVCQYGNVLNPTTKAQFGLSGGVFPCEDGHHFMAPVKSFRPNAWGLYDMTGNANEWVQDLLWVYPGSTTDYVNNSSGSARVHRGASWGGDPSNARVAFRHAGLTDFRNGVLGFRLARTPQ